MKITKEQVFEAATAFVAEGKTPTVAAIRSALGAGSYTTINDYMREWREANKTSPAKEAAPQSILDRLTAAGNEVWAHALLISDERIEAERAEMTAAKAEMDEQQRQIAAEADEMAAQLAQALSDMATTQGEAYEIGVLLEQERLAHEHTKGFLREASGHVESIRELNDRTHERLEMMAERKRDLDEEVQRLRTELENERTEVVKLRESQAAAIREVNQLKSLVDKLELKAENLRESIQGHKADKETAIEQERQARAAALEEMTKAAQLRGEAEALRKQLDQQAEILSGLVGKKPAASAQAKKEAKPEQSNR